MTDITAGGGGRTAGEAGGAAGTSGSFGMKDSPGSDDASRGGELSEDAGVAAERERLARQLRETRMQLAMTQTRLAALEQSATMKFGRTVANAAKKPWPRGALLPRDLYRLWKDRGAPKSGAANAATALANAQLADLKGTGGRFLSALTAPGVLWVADPALALSGVGAIGGGGAAATGAGLVIAGAISELGCATLAPDAVVHPLLPHDADVLLEGTGADLVLIEAAALLPGTGWAYATDPAAADRGRRLARLIVLARSLGKPVVFVRNVPATLMPGIGWLAASCDAVVDGDLGVQLARFNPIGVSVARPTAPVYAGERDPREAPAVRVLLDSLTGSVANRGNPPVRLVPAPAGRSWRSLPSLYRDHGVFVTASAAQGREQLACGARVIGPLGSLGSGTSASAVREELAAARAEAPASPGEVRVWLRDIFAKHATPARLAAIARAAGLSAGLNGGAAGGLAAGRQVAVLTVVRDAAQARGLAAALLAQRLRPAEVVAAADDPHAVPAVRDALGALTDHDIRVVVVPSLTSGSALGTGGVEWARPLARLAAAPWVAPWTADGGQPPEHLLDLACARECAQADAVGFGAVEYEFTRWLDEPALIRAALLAPSGSAAGDWGSHGLRLFTVTPTTGTPTTGTPTTGTPATGTPTTGIPRSEH
jgi:hypothetical protein